MYMTKKNGFTTVELIVTFTLVSVITYLTSSSSLKALLLLFFRHLILLLYHNVIVGDNFCTVKYFSA